MKNCAWVVINPVAGGGKGLTHQDRIVASLEKIYDKVECIITQEKNEGIAIGRKACEAKIDAIYCVGGDGTVQEVVKGIAQQPYRPKLGVLPLGTYNALARMLKMPMAFEKSIQRLEDNHTRQIDIGKINDTYFLFLVGVGKLAEPFHQVTSEQKGKFGMLSYFFEGVKKIPEDRPYTYVIKTPEEEFEVEASLLLFALTNYLGSIKFSDANIDPADGKGHLLILKNVDILQKTQVLLNVLQQQVEKSTQVISLMTDRVRIEVREKNPPETDIDGDRGPDFPLEIQVLEKHIEIFAP